MTEQQFTKESVPTTRYANLDDICGGRITVERLEVFRRAIPEFHLFIDNMRQLLAPLDDSEGVPDPARAAPGRREISDVTDADDGLGDLRDSVPRRP